MRRLLVKGFALGVAQTLRLPLQVQHAVPSSLRSTAALQADRERFLRAEARDADGASSIGDLLWHYYRLESVRPASRSVPLLDTEAGLVFYRSDGFDSEDGQEPALLRLLRYYWRIDAVRPLSRTVPLLDTESEGSVYSVKR